MTQVMVFGRGLQGERDGPGAGGISRALMGKDTERFRGVGYGEQNVEVGTVVTTDSMSTAREQRVSGVRLS